MVAPPCQPPAYSPLPPLPRNPHSVLQNFCLWEKSGFYRVTAPTRYQPARWPVSRKPHTKPLQFLCEKNVEQSLVPPSPEKKVAFAHFSRLVDQSHKILTVPCKIFSVRKKCLLPGSSRLVPPCASRSSQKPNGFLLWEKRCLLTLARKSSQCLAKYSLWEKGSFFRVFSLLVFTPVSQNSHNALQFFLLWGKGGFLFSRLVDRRHEILTMP